MTPYRLTAFVVAVLFSAPVLACDAPGERPAIPDPDTAVTAQMVKSNNEIKAYVRAQEEYLGCADMSSGEKREALEELETYADTFNQAVRQFKLASN